ncbi:hypothetical protein [Ornithinimicrobium faecis]|uniref:hypothetical protein n=1 Tax=Ornithinimicrobium faecis TaxID=2934158 RepID=UPI0021179A30|nr:hypothetical protein [Ornithinimicrobium sp. HY1745]
MVRQVADPTTVSAGDLVELSFPQETERGVPWVLEEQDGDTWHQRYLLWSDGNGGTPDWVGHEDEERWGWDDVGVSGPGPDTVLVPDTAAAGPYRLCTANARENFCAELEVVTG